MDWGSDNNLHIHIYTVLIWKTSYEFTDPENENKLIKLGERLNSIQLQMKEENHISWTMKRKQH